MMTSLSLGQIRPKMILVLFFMSLILSLIIVLAPTGNFTLEHNLDKRFALLSARFANAEKMSQQRRNDLQKIVSQFSQITRMLQAPNSEDNGLQILTNLSKTSIWGQIEPATEAIVKQQNWTSDLSIPSVHHFLPHTVGHPKSFVPNFKISKNRNPVSMVLGIPTVKREKQSYLSTTLKSLFENMSESEKSDCLVVIFVAEFDLQYVMEIANEVQDQFPEHIESGLLEVISPPAEFYPDMTKLRLTLDDTQDRVQWRSKQNLDYAFLMMYSLWRGTFYVQLEDDIITKLGFIGKMFKGTSLPTLIQFMLMFYNDKPGDWLLTHIIETKVCRVEERKRKKCKKQLGELWVNYKPSLFQHIGTHSSLKGKVQNLKDKEFGDVKLFVGHKTNPIAEVQTTLVHYKNFDLTRAYYGKSYFWAFAPTAEDNIVFRFTPPVKISELKFVSGNIEHSLDIFVNTTVEVLFDGDTDFGNFTKLGDNFVVLGEFDWSGSFAANVTFGLLANQLRLTFHSPSDSWVLLSEIEVKTL